VQKEKVLQIELEKHASDVQAILMNPPWAKSFEIDEKKTPTKKSGA
jgi:tRNA1(Val) A37 N6-methylase TrmN6